MVTAARTLRAAAVDDEGALEGVAPDGAPLPDPQAATSGERPHTPTAGFPPGGPGPIPGFMSPPGSRPAGRLRFTLRGGFPGPGRPARCPPMRA